MHTLKPASVPLITITDSCDGVIVETEELHRKAYNAAFAAFQCTIDGKPLVWSTEYYVSYTVLKTTWLGSKECFVIYNVTNECVINPLPSPVHPAPPL